MFPSWILGVVLSITACGINNLGINLQKYAHNVVKKEKEREKLITEEKQSLFYTQPMWIGGILMTVVGALCDLGSFGYAPQSLLAPLGALSLVFNMYIASMLLGEILTWREIGFTLLICAGTVIAVLFGDKADEPNYTVGILESYYQRTPFVIFASLHATLIIGIAIFIRSTYSNSNDLAQRRQAVAFPALAGLAF